MAIGMIEADFFGSGINSKITAEVSKVAMTVVGNKAGKDPTKDTSKNGSPNNSDDDSEELNTKKIAMTFDEAITTGWIDGGLAKNANQQAADNTWNTMNRRDLKGIIDAKPVKEIGGIKTTDSNDQSSNQCVLRSNKA